MFSARIPTLGSNRIARALLRQRTAGRLINDLTVSNPTCVGFDYPDGLLDLLASSEALRYNPAPLGEMIAREAVACHLTQRGVSVSPDRVVLTASTSDAYTMLFKLLCDPADLVLTPQPSYPLFEHLARLDGLVARPYLLEYHGRWVLNVDSLYRVLEPRAKAIVLVNPNNPTGSYVQSDELDAVRAIATHSELALISDEVFGSYPMDESFAYSSGPLVAEAEALTFTLGGLSKSAGLPQLKLGWIIVGGPDGLVRRALNRLEFICDSYLSVATPVQLAVGMLIDQTRPLADAIRRRVQMNYLLLCSLVRRFPVCQVLHIDAGWYAVIQVPAIRSEEALVVELIEQDQVLAHPGYFFDFPNEAFLVVSLLPESGCFAEAVTKILKRASA
ncbi:MAG: pyridoxal phosphate-dependent aminotransferase [Acidobacteriota bacterium]|nr:pyridoxal phosphate-dependent aminotransferase [Acidobacteriota bacterium]